jgi:hypothetical protein
VTISAGRAGTVGEGMTALRVQLAVAVAGVLLLGCGKGGGGTTGEGADAGDPYAGFASWPAALNRKLDVLLMIDDASGGEFPQIMFAEALPAFQRVLETFPGGFPDAHVAVVTSDMGVGNPDIPNCRATSAGDGVFRSGVGSVTSCSTTGLDPAATFLVTSGGSSPIANFTGELATVLGCIVPLGAAGCGFEQPLASVVRALGADGDPPPPGNEGFLRADAALAIVLLSNEDDCSSPDPGFYDLTSNDRLSSPLGPVGNFRCAEFGHLCGGAPPARLAPGGDITAVVEYDGCVSAEIAGKLTPVARLAAQIKLLKPDGPGRIVLTNILGPVTPYRIVWKSPGIATDGPWPDVGHSCVSTRGYYGAPGVRRRDLARQFGENGLEFSICDDSFVPALEATARALGRAMGNGCVAGPVATRKGSLVPDCTVVERVPRPGGGTDDTPIPACADGAPPPCWEVVPSGTEDVTCTGRDGRLVIDRGGAPAIADHLIAAKCTRCDPAMPDPPRDCL